jgi:hypothetical protein
MKIDDSKTTRAALKNYFRKNMIPTEGQFAQFIDSGLNQRDDGLVKAANDPLSIEAVGDDTSFKKALNFYSRFVDADPAWTISLRPRAKPDDPGSGRPALSINDSAGRSRLSVDSATGRVGVGVVAPGEALDVAGRVKAGGLTIGPWEANENYLFVGANSLDQTKLGNYALLQGSANSGASDRGRGSDKGRTFLNSPVDISFRINNAELMMLSDQGLAAENICGSRPFRIDAGMSTNQWVQYGEGLYIDVDTSFAGFTATPYYITDLVGGSAHWTLTGGSCVYGASPTGFRIYIRQSNNSTISPTDAVTNGWRIQWIGIQR